MERLLLIVTAAGLVAGLEAAASRPLGLRVLVVALLILPLMAFGVWQILDILSPVQWRTAGGLAVIGLGAHTVFNATRVSPSTPDPLSVYLLVVVHASEGLSVALPLARLSGHPIPMLLWALGGFTVGLCLGPGPPRRRIAAGLGLIASGILTFAVRLP